MPSHSGFCHRKGVSHTSSLCSVLPGQCLDVQDGECDLAGKTTLIEPQVCRTTMNLSLKKLWTFASRALHVCGESESSVHDYSSSHIKLSVNGSRTLAVI